jgi:signal transduction histidine kinase
MSVAGKLVLILAVVAAVPLGVSTVMSLGTYTGELDRQLQQLHARTAQYGVRTTAGTIETTQRTIRGLARTIPWADLSAEERHGALVLVYEQLDDTVIVTLRDAGGGALGEVLHPPGTRTTGHPRIPSASLAAFAAAIEPALPGHGWTMGEPIVTAGHPPLVPMSLAIAGTGGASWTLAIGFSLGGVCNELAATAPAGVTTRLVDAHGHALCGPIMALGDALTASHATARGWSVIAEQPRDVAFASIRRIHVQTVLWIVVGVLAAMIAGFVLTRAIRRPLRRLTAGADALASGALDHRVVVEGDDEFGALAAAFNRMSDEIERNASEIRDWNAELQARVDAQTKDLREAQDQLLQSRKLGAVTALGAGIAHEINNPLMGVLGMTQILLARKDQLDERTVRNLTTIEREALRVRDIVERMSSLARESIGDAVRLDLATVVDAAATANAGKLAAAHVELERAFAPDLPRVFGNATQLEQALSQLIDNSIRAMPGGGHLKLAIRETAGELVTIDVVDTGRGIAPELLDKIFEPFFTTKDDWRGVGLGLTLAHRIVEVHQGRIRASSQLGSGTTMTVTLPAARHGAHLQ